MDNEFFITFNIKKELLKNQIEVSPEIARYLQIDSDIKLMLSVGMLNLEVMIFIKRNNYKKEEINISHSDLKKLCLRPNTKYGITKKGKQIKIGPVVGIMEVIFVKGKRPFLNQTTFFNELVSTGGDMGEICYVFSPYAINWQRNTVAGYQSNGDKWQKKIFPLPNVIYPRESGYIKKIATIRKRLEKKGCKFINPPLIGKWRTFKILSQNKEIAKNLPDTLLINKFKSVEKMLNKYNAVYMKPINGSQGKNIIRVVKKKKSKLYAYQYQLNNQIYGGKVLSIMELKKRLRKVMGNKPYIVQRQINLLRRDNRVVDIRIIVQKDQTGKWQITGKACRIGRKGAITSNISSGGNASQVSIVISEYFRNATKSQNIITEIDKLALNVAQELEKGVGSIGELGIDIGVDDKGLIWFIEANLKPGRYVFRLINDKNTRQKSIERPLLYARYLADFE